MRILTVWNARREDLKGAPTQTDFDDFPLHSTNIPKLQGGIQSSCLKKLTCVNIILAQKIFLTYFATVLTA